MGSALRVGWGSELILEISWCSSLAKDLHTSIILIPFFGFVDDKTGTEVNLAFFFFFNPFGSGSPDAVFVLSIKYKRYSFDHRHSGSLFPGLVRVSVPWSHCDLGQLLVLSLVWLNPERLESLTSAVIRKSAQWLAASPFPTLRGKSTRTSSIYPEEKGTPP